MAFKFLSFFALVAVAHAGIVSYEAPQVHYSQPIAYHQPSVTKVISQPAQLVKHVHAAPALAVTKTVEDYDHNPQYSFAYDVQDGLTGDSKSQHETRNGDVVEGHYSLIDSDGHKRTVHYTADPVHGFNAQVHREPLHAKTIVASAPVVHKTVVASPAVVKTVSSPAYVSHQPIVAHHAPAVVKTVASPAYVSHQPIVAHHAPAVVKTVASPAYVSHQPIVAHQAPVAYAHQPTYYHH